MGTFGIFHWLVVLIVVLVLFGAGRIPAVMGDFAKGIKAFRSGLKDDGDKPAEPAAQPALQSGAVPMAAAAHAQPAEAKPTAPGSSAAG